MYDTVGTNLALVQEKIKSTETSRSEMISALNKLIDTINNTTEWKGADAERYKAVLLDFCQKLLNCARWMDAAGVEAIKHSNKLLERAIASQNVARMFD